MGIKLGKEAKQSKSGRRKKVWDVDQARERVQAVRFRDEKEGVGWGSY